MIKKHLPLIVMILLAIAALTLHGCTKEGAGSGCYSCDVRASGNDTVICDRSKSQLDADPSLMPNCVHN